MTGLQPYATPAPHSNHSHIFVQCCWHNISKLLSPPLWVAAGRSRDPCCSLSYVEPDHCGQHGKKKKQVMWIIRWPSVQPETRNSLQMSLFPVQYRPLNPGRHGARVWRCFSFSLFLRPPFFPLSVRDITCTVKTSIRPVKFSISAFIYRCYYNIDSLRVMLI